MVRTIGSVDRNNLKKRKKANNQISKPRFQPQINEMPVEGTNINSLIGQ